MKGAFEYLPQRAKESVRERLGVGRDSGGDVTFIPDDRQLAQFRSRGHVRIDKSRELLGYHPKFDFERGIGMTLKYVDWAFRSPKN
jgi:nucleoside-diphosphate-sugar epimerase